MTHEETPAMDWSGEARIEDSSSITVEAADFARQLGKLAREASSPPAFDIVLGRIDEHNDRLEHLLFVLGEVNERLFGDDSTVGDGEDEEGELRAAESGVIALLHARLGRGDELMTRLNAEIERLREI